MEIRQDSEVIMTKSSTERNNVRSGTKHTIDFQIDLFDQNEEFWEVTGDNWIS